MTEYLDAKALAELERMCGEMTLEELRRFCAGTLRAATVGQRVMMRKFGLATWEEFNAAVENDRITMDSGD